MSDIHNQAPVVIWRDARTRWLSGGSEVSDLIGPESADSFDVRAIAESSLLRRRVGRPER